MIHAITILRAELPCKTGHVVFDEVEQARATLQCGCSICFASAIAEKLLKDESRMRFGGQWCGGRGPGEVVLIHAGEAVVALTDDLHQIHREFERWKLRLLTDGFRGDLIRRGAVVVVAALGVLHSGGTEETRIRGRVCAGIRGLEFEIGNNGAVLLHRIERLQDR